MLCTIAQPLSVLLWYLALQVRQLMEKMDMDHDGNVGGDEFLATLIDWGQVRTGWLSWKGVCRTPWGSGSHGCSRSGKTVLIRPSTASIWVLMSKQILLHCLA
jgi:hypothetical protein